MGKEAFHLPPRWKKITRQYPMIIVREIDHQNSLIIKIGLKRLKNAIPRKAYIPIYPRTNKFITIQRKVKVCRASRL